MNEGDGCEYMNERIVDCEVEKKKNYFLPKANGMVKWCLPMRFGAFSLSFPLLFLQANFWLFSEANCPCWQHSSQPVEQCGYGMEWIWPATFCTRCDGTYWHAHCTMDEWPSFLAHFSLGTIPPISRSIPYSRIVSALFCILLSNGCRLHLLFCSLCKHIFCFW